MYRDCYVEPEAVKKFLLYSFKRLSSLHRLFLFWGIIQIEFQTLISARTFMDCAPFLIFSTTDGFPKGTPSFFVWLRSRRGADKEFLHH